MCHPSCPARAKSDAVVSRIHCRYQTINDYAIIPSLRIASCSSLSWFIASIFFS